MLTASTSSSSTATLNNALRAVRNLPRIQLPEKPTKKGLLESINKCDEYIVMAAPLLLSSKDIDDIVAAFSAIPNKSNITFKVSQIFVQPHYENYDDLVKLWEGVKYKVRRVIWEEDKFYKRFIKRLEEEKKTDPNIAEFEWRTCDHTNSSASQSSQSPTTASVIYQHATQQLMAVRTPSTPATPEPVVYSLKAAPPFLPHLTVTLLPAAPERQLRQASALPAGVKLSFANQQKRQRSCPSPDPIVAKKQLTSLRQR